MLSTAKAPAGHTVGAGRMRICVASATYAPPVYPCLQMEIAPLRPKATWRLNRSPGKVLVTPGVVHVRGTGSRMEAEGLGSDPSSALPSLCTCGPHP